MCEAEGQQTVVQMIAIRRERRSSRANARKHHCEGIHDGQSQQQQRECGAQRRGLALCGHQCQRAHAESEHLAAAIPHEDARGMRVESQEAQDSPGFDQSHGGDGQIAADHGEQRDRGQAQERHPSGQTVQPVSEVYRIGDADQEQERDADGDGLRQNDGSTTDEGADVHPADDHTDTRREDLTRELRAVAEGHTIVPHTEEQQDGKTQQQAPNGGSQRYAEQRRHCDAGRHRQPAHARNGHRMHFARAGCIRETDRRRPT